MDPRSTPRAPGGIVAARKVVPVGDRGKERVLPLTDPAVVRRLIREAGIRFHDNGGD